MNRTSRCFQSQSIRPKRHWHTQSLTHARTHTHIRALCSFQSVLSWQLAAAIQWNVKALRPTHRRTHTHIDEVLPWCFSYTLGTILKVTPHGNSPAKRGGWGLIIWVICWPCFLPLLFVTFSSSRWFDIYCRKVATNRLLNVCISGDKRGKLKRKKIWNFSSKAFFSREKKKQEGKVGKRCRRDKQTHNTSPELIRRHIIG